MLIAIFYKKKNLHVALAMNAYESYSLYLMCAWTLHCTVARGVVFHVTVSKNSKFVTKVIKTIISMLNTRHLSRSTLLQRMLEALSHAVGGGMVLRRPLSKTQVYTLCLKENAAELWRELCRISTTSLSSDKYIHVCQTLKWRDFLKLFSVKFATVLHFCISQRNVATCLSCGWKYYNLYW